MLEIGLGYNSLTVHNGSWPYCGHCNCVVHSHVTVFIDYNNVFCDRAVHNVCVGVIRALTNTTQLYCCVYNNYT